MLTASLSVVLLDAPIRLNYGIAFAAGLLSFLSPCVFPLLPAYLAYLGGQVGAAALEPVAEGPGAATLALGSRPRRRRAPVLASGVAFVAGFSAVFITLFYVFTALRLSLFTAHRHAFDVGAGIVVVVLALQTLGLIRFGWLMRERRLHLFRGGTGLLPAFLLGISFAAGWTPCIGPQLALILQVAGQGDFAGLPVMATYCLGLALPFLAFAVLTDRLQGVIRAVNRHLGVINLVAGALLLVFGLLLILDRYTLFSQYAPGGDPLNL